MFSRKLIRRLRFSRRGEYIGGRAVSGGGPGGPTTWWHGQGVTTQDFIKFWGKIFAFVLLEMIGISQGFKNF
jgi:hypothetical protein